MNLKNKWVILVGMGKTRTRKRTGRKERRRQLAFRFASSVLLICILIVGTILGIKLFSYRTVALADMTDVTFTGYSTLAKADLILDSTILYEEQKNKEDIDNFLSSVQMTINKEDKIANGDALVVEYSFDEELAKKAKLKIDASPYEETAAGIEEAVFLTVDDLFKDVSIGCEGISPAIKVTVENTSKDPVISAIRFAPYNNVVEALEKVEASKEEEAEEIDETNLAQALSIEGNQAELINTLLEGEDENFTSIYCKKGEELSVIALVDEETLKTENDIIIIHDEDTDLFVREFNVTGEDEYLTSGTQVTDGMISQMNAVAVGLFDNATEYGMRIFSEAGITPAFITGNQPSPFSFGGASLLSAYFERLEPEGYGVNGTHMNAIKLVYSTTVSQAATGHACGAEVVVQFTNLILKEDGSVVLNSADAKIISATHRDRYVKQLVNNSLAGNMYVSEKIR